MGICAVQSKPHVATLPRPSLIRMNLSSVIGKSNDHQLISPVGLEQIEWRDEVEKKDIAPSSITFGNAATKPTNKAFVPSYTGTIVLDENGEWLPSRRGIVATEPSMLTATGIPRLPALLQCHCFQFYRRPAVRMHVDSLLRGIRTSQALGRFPLPKRWHRCRRQQTSLILCWVRPTCLRRSQATEHWRRRWRIRAQEASVE